MFKFWIFKSRFLIIGQQLKLLKNMSALHGTYQHTTNYCASKKKRSTSCHHNITTQYSAIPVPGSDPNQPSLRHCVLAGFLDPAPKMSKCVRYPSFLVLCRNCKHIIYSHTHKKNVLISNYKLLFLLSTLPQSHPTDHSSESLTLLPIYPSPCLKEPV